MSTTRLAFASLLCLASAAMLDADWPEDAVAAAVHQCVIAVLYAAGLTGLGIVALLLTRR